jgi:hypothetical protein
MASQVAWLNFDAEQQRRTQLMMAALAAQGTVDELGLGVIRDLIAGALHPGMTVLLTRAKYLLFVPRVYRGLTGRSTDAVLAEGRRVEGRLIRELVAYYRDQPGEDDRGIIGRRQGDDTKQLASSVYWALLRSLQILYLPGSVTDYCRHVAEQAASRHMRTLLHSEEDVDESADEVWRELPKESAGAPASFDLSLDEAEWLRQRFVVSEHRPTQSRSLLSWLLDTDRAEWIVGVTRVWEHPLASQFPSATGEVMRLGRDLDRLVHGARILYNLLCARGRPPGIVQDELVERYESALQDWRAELRRDGLPSARRLTQLDGWTRQALEERAATFPAQMRWRTAYHFLQRWQRAVERDIDLRHDAVAARLIVQREVDLKPGRARLRDPALLTDWLGDSGYGRFDFNWAVTRRILTDIHTGLGTPLVSVWREA